MEKTDSKRMGLKLLLCDEGYSTATVLVLVEVGSKYETKDINGLFTFLEHVFLKAPGIAQKAN